MNNLHLSMEAQNDLIEIKRYITEELLNPSAATNTVRTITVRLRLLQSFAYAGAPLSSAANIESDYRYLVCGDYLAFYRVYEPDIYIDRILNIRRDYMRILFGGTDTDDVLDTE